MRERGVVRGSIRSSRHWSGSSTASQISVLAASAPMPCTSHGVSADHVAADADQHNARHREHDAAAEREREIGPENRPRHRHGTAPAAAAGTETSPRNLSPSRCRSGAPRRPRAASGTARPHPFRASNGPRSSPTAWRNRSIRLLTDSLPATSVRNDPCASSESSASSASSVATRVPFDLRVSARRSAPGPGLEHPRLAHQRERLRAAARSRRDSGRRPERSAPAARARWPAAPRPG